MSDYNAIALLGKIQNFRNEALGRLAWCQTEAARKIHEALAEQLGRIIGVLCEEIQTEHDFRICIETPDDLSLYEIYFSYTRFQDRWINEGAISLLDVDIVADWEGEVFTYQRDDVIINSADELEGLPELLEAIALETGVVFVVPFG
jgi:nucleoside-triphosphatase THEP1